MTETEIAEMMKDLDRIGGKYAQAKLFIKMLPKGSKKRLYGVSCKRQDVAIRRELIILLRNKYQLTFPAISELLGYGDHTSVMHHYQKAKRTK